MRLLIAANGSVVAASGEGKVTVVRPGDSLEVLTQADFGEPIFATPAPAAGRPVCSHECASVRHRLAS
jgi:hypothetical protein